MIYFLITKQRVAKQLEIKQANQKGQKKMAQVKIMSSFLPLFCMICMSWLSSQMVMIAVGQECPTLSDKFLEQKRRQDECLASDEKYFERLEQERSTKQPKLHEFTGQSEMEIPDYWHKHFLIYHNVGMRGNELITWGLPASYLQNATRYVRKYSICKGEETKGSDVQTQLEYNDEALSDADIEKVCDIRYDNVVSFLITPCRIDNAFHLHNDVLLPTFIDLLESNNLLQPNKQAFVFRGDSSHWKNAVPFFHILYDMFQGKVQVLDDVAFDPTTRKPR
ncbi:hypothetical protein RFI_14611, partial [Reticulomyxa filosa]